MAPFHFSGNVCNPFITRSRTCISNPLQRGQQNSPPGALAPSRDVLAIAGARFMALVITAFILFSDHFVQRAAGAAAPSDSIGCDDPDNACHTLERQACYKDLDPETATIIDCKDQDFHGTIPRDIDKFVNLKEIWINENKLEGGIPRSLGNLSKLERLSLNQNVKLGGTIPSELGKLTKLRYLSSPKTNLKGSIPHTLGNLTELILLYLKENGNLGGTIPSALGKLTKLQELHLGRTDIEGTIPHTLGNLRELKHLNIDYTNVGGTIPSQLGKLTKLRQLLLHRNELGGSIPHSLGNLPELIELHLDRNKLMGGTIPRELGKLTKLLSLRLYRNYIGCLPTCLHPCQENASAYNLRNELRDGVCFIGYDEEPEPTAFCDCDCAGPNACPTPSPTASPSGFPSESPSSSPSISPSPSPTLSPTVHFRIAGIRGCPVQGCSPKGGSMITIDLKNNEELFIDKRDIVEIIIHDATDSSCNANVTKECQVREPTNRSAITCMLPQGRGSELDVMVTIGGVVKTFRGGISYEECPDGSVPRSKGNALQCGECKPGMFAISGASKCAPCTGNTFSRSGATYCSVCPDIQTKGGVKCIAGILEPQPGFWSATKDATAEFNAETVFPCLNETSCIANTSTYPANAYYCAPGHNGTLCAQCLPGYYFKRKKCRRCDENVLSPGAVAAIVIALSMSLIVLVYKLFLRRKAKGLLKMLHGSRRHYTTRKRQQARSPPATGGNVVKQSGTIKRWTVHLRATAVQVVHASVKSAQENIFGNSETLRILLNICKVTSHLYSTLSYCIKWPRAMENLLTLAATFSLDIFSEAKLPCLITEFSYFTRVKIAVVAPIVMAALFGCAGCTYAYHKARRRKREKSKLRKSMVKRERARGSHNVVKDGCWVAAPYLLFTLDVFHPVITKTLCSFFTCRNLGVAGWWLEQAYAVQCSEASENNSEHVGKYKASWTWVAIAAIVYSLGVPLFFYFLVCKFKPLALGGDKVVSRALNWMYAPLRNGCEWWPVEILQHYFRLW